MKCKYKNCRCEIMGVTEDKNSVGADVSKEFDQAIDFTPHSTAETGDADAAVPADKPTLLFCSSHCAEEGDDTSKSCGCGHGEC